MKIICENFECYFMLKIIVCIIIKVGIGQWYYILFILHHDYMKIKLFYEMKMRMERLQGQK